MHELWSSSSYEPHLLSLPFALAPATMLIVIAYAAVMRGAPTLRGFLLANCISLFPYSAVVALSPSIQSREVAALLFRIAGAFIPLVGAAATGFQMALLGRYRRYRTLLWLMIASGVLWVFVGTATKVAIDDVRPLLGFWYPHAGPWAWVAMVHTIAMVIPGFALLGHAALTGPPSNERRQLRAALVANFVVLSSLVDLALAYGIGWFPIGWLLSGIGSLLVVRALVVEDLLRVRAVDTTAPALVLYFAAGALLAWVALTELAPTVPWPLTALTLLLCFAAVRIAVAAMAMITRGARSGEGPLDRLLAQLVGRARSLAAPPAIAELAIDVIELGLGIRARVLLASQDDWGWSTETGERLDDARAPDPLVGSWLAERRDPVFADDLDTAPPELRELLAPLFAHHAARALIPVGTADELLGVILVPAAGRRLRVPALGFLVRAAERLAEALLHARLARRAAERAALAREVELAATVQAELLPGSGPQVHGAITVVGSWRPATRCAGDFWIVTPLGPLGPPGPPGEPAGAADLRPVLVAIGDVTGHGVASAMVTAAVIAACDVSVRRAGAALELGGLITALDAAVRRVGGGELAMTCCAAILDPAGGEIRFVSCGHPAPYLCRVPAADTASDRPIQRSETGGEAAGRVPRGIERSETGGGDPDGFAGGAGGRAPRGIERSETGGGDPDGFAGGAGGRAPRGIERSETGGGDPDGFAGGAGGKAPRGIELHALVGRGNPLGAGPPGVRVQRRSLQAGDLVVWYTDGVVEAQDPSGAPFGDRRLQHLLKKLDRQRLTPPAVHGLVLRGVAAHRAGRPLADDETLVVAQVAPATSPGPVREAAP